MFVLLDNTICNIAKNNFGVRGCVLGVPVFLPVILEVVINHISRIILDNSKPCMDRPLPYLGVEFTEFLGQRKDKVVHPVYSSRFFGLFIVFLGTFGVDVGLVNVCLPAFVEGCFGFTAVNLSDCS